ncbi:SLC13 family permease [Roseicella sp. DB1501]|uniref:SLC13 family permease n=1 Tax=Roseicella sp. DB1501 TaxID=2730925 RepID=UPI0014925544|nr:SLC13 family permease [Roseicella sp. DB1501]NOG71260.1 SLC13 family permease [Roseicella sp. DB1501]
MGPIRLGRLALTLDQVLVFAILAGMVALFIWGRFRYDLVALLALLAAMMCGVVPVEKAFAGFGDQVVVIIASALVLSAAVSKSSLIGRSIRHVEPRLRTTSARVAALTTGVTVLSAVMKNIGALAIFLPIAVQVARRSGTSPSMLLMPMSFGSLVGGLVTLVGTSPNILVSRVRAELIGQPFAMFDFAPVGLGIAGAALAFLAFGWRLLPGGHGAQAARSAIFEVEPYLSEARLPEGSPLVGKSVAELEARSEGEVTVMAILREGDHRYVPAGHWTLYAGDLLVLRSNPHALQRIVAQTGLRLGDAGSGPVKTVSGSDIGVVEAVVMPGSALVGCSPAQLRLREVHGVSLLAIARRGQAIATRLRQLSFQAGDVLVLQGGSGAMPDALRTLGCLPLVDRATGLGERRHNVLPLLLLGMTMAVVSLELAPVAGAFFGAAVLAVLSGIVTLREAYEALDLPILVLLACLIPISDAVAGTGGAGMIAGGLAVVAGGLPPIGAVALVLLAAMALTPFLNNAATALIMAPIAASLATKLGLNPDPLLMAVAIGCACDFLTPIGHQCNTLVMGPGGYRFGDYWRLGLPLSITVIVVATTLIPIFWPLR